MSRLILETRTVLCDDQAFAFGSQLRLHCTGWSSSCVVLATHRDGTRWRLYVPGVIVVSNNVRECLARMWSACCCRARLFESPIKYQFVDEDDDTDTDNWRCVSVFNDLGEKMATVNAWCGSINPSPEQIEAFAFNPRNSYLQLCSTVAVEEEARFRRRSFSQLVDGDEHYPAVPWNTEIYCSLEALVTSDVVLVDPFTEDTGRHDHEGVLLVSASTIVFSLIVRSPPCCELSMVQMRVVAVWRVGGALTRIWRLCMQCKALISAAAVDVHLQHDAGGGGRPLYNCCYANDIARHMLWSVRPTNWFDLPSEAVAYPAGLTHSTASVGWRRVDAECVAHIVNNVAAPIEWCSSVLPDDESSSPPVIVYEHCTVDAVLGAITVTPRMLICSVSALRVDWWHDRIERASGLRSTHYNGSVLDVTSAVSVTTLNSLLKMSIDCTALVVEHAGRLADLLFTDSILGEYREAILKRLIALVRRVTTIYLVGDNGVNLLDSVFVVWLKTLRSCTVMNGASLVDLVNDVGGGQQSGIVSSGCTGFLPDSDDEGVNVSIEQQEVEEVEEVQWQTRVVETKMEKLHALVNSDQRVAIFVEFDNMLPYLTRQLGLIAQRDVLVLTKENKSTNRDVASNARARLHGVRVLLLSPSAAVCVDHRHFDVLVVVHHSERSLLATIQQAMSCITRVPLVSVLSEQRRNVMNCGDGLPTLGQSIYRHRQALWPTLVGEAHVTSTRMSWRLFQQWLHDRQRMLEQGH
jgi:hypothetical protein